MFGIVILILMFAGLYYMLSAPTTLNGGLVESSTLTFKKEINVTLYANALGWDYGIKGDQPNPTFNITPGTKICFTVIEDDTAPHTLTIADSAKESGTHLTLITTSQLTTTIGHTVKASYIFDKLGTWTYWCEIHPTTMLGAINVVTANATATSQFSSNNANVHNSYNSINFSNELNTKYTNLIISNLYNPLGVLIA
ncbi:MAG: cupredoxin domain-containing protein [Thermoplasmataceae archaeon]